MSARAARGLGIAAVLCAAAAILATPIAAQGGPPPGVGGGGALRLSLSQEAIAFPMPGIAEFDAGWVDATGITAEVTDRGRPDTWELRVRADVADMGGYGKPVGDILFRPEGSNTWTPLSTTDQVIAQGSGDGSVTIYFRLRLDYAADLPDNYTADLTFYIQAL